MSNNAEGFRHITFNTTKPIKTFVGNFEWQVISGRLESSGFTPPRTDLEHAGTKLYIPYGSNKITPDDCWEQIREWAADFARAQVKKTPEGKILATLEDNKRASYKEIMEAGSPDSLKATLHNNLKKDGLSWNKEVKALPPAGTIN